MNKKRKCDFFIFIRMEGNKIKMSLKRGEPLKEETLKDEWMSEGNVFQSLGAKTEKAFLLRPEEKELGTSGWEDDKDQRNCGCYNMIMEDER